jgi:branched-chain amino acid transport system permease protein
MAVVEEPRSRPNARRAARPARVARAAAPDTGLPARRGDAGKMPGIGLHPLAWLLIAVLLFLPAFVGTFILVGVVGYAMILGMIALSLMFLAGYGGMVSLAQMTVAGCAAYMVAIFGVSAIDTISLKWPWWAAVPVAILIATVFGTICGALSVRTEGIYTIMITLAIASAFFYFTNQNYTIFNGFTGFNAVRPPVAFGVDWVNPVPFYYLVLFWAAVSYFVVVYVARSPFGLALQGIRDNPRRMAALGFNVTAHRIAAYAFASVIAAVAGVLLVWYQQQVSPGTAGVAWVVNILIIAVVGGIGRPIGPFIGAIIFVLLSTFAVDVLENLGLDGKRFQLLIGLGFLAIVLFSPDGVLGLWERWQKRNEKGQSAPSGGGGH